MYYGKLLRQIANALGKLSERIDRVGDQVKENTEASHAANASEEKQSHIKKLWSEKVFAADQKTVGENAARQEESNRTQKSIKRATWAAFIAASLYGIIAAIQAYEMKLATDASICAARAATRSAQTSKEALTSVQRAFLSVNTFDITRLVKGQSFDGSVRIAFSWENGGDTPTKDMEVLVSSTWLPKPMPESYPLEKMLGQHPLHMFVGPKSSSRSQPLVIPSHDVLAIYHHSGHLYIWGKAAYRDVFNGSPVHETMFCTELTDVNGDPLGGGPVNIQTASCDHGNCADEECKAK
ncbi:MAG: hypothetical protein WCA10_25060 [Terracidiphilus sp.]